MANEVVASTLSQENMELARAMEEVVADYGLVQNDDTAGNMVKALAQSQGIQRLQALMTKEVVDKHFMPLMNTPLGFKTDRDPAKKDRTGKSLVPYEWNVVRDVIIQATFMGLYPIGNEVNIIGGNMYGTKAAYERLMKEEPGISDFTPKIGLSTRRSDYEVEVEASATWRQDGNPMSWGPQKIAVRVNRGQGEDAIQGKAKRKLLAAVLGFIRGSEHSLPEGDVDDMTALPAGTTQRAQLTMKPGDTSKHTDPGDVQEGRESEKGEAGTSTPPATPAAETPKSQQHQAPSHPPDDFAPPDDLEESPEDDGKKLAGRDFTPQPGDTFSCDKPECHGVMYEPNPEKYTKGFWCCEDCHRSYTHRKGYYSGPKRKGGGRQR